MEGHVAVEVGSGDRRNTGRCAVTLAAEVHLPAGRLPLKTSDASAGGVFVCSAHVPPPWTPLHLVLHLPDGPLESVATVVRVLPGIGMGCRLSVPGVLERQRWLRFLESVPPPREVVMEDVLLDDSRDLFDFGWSNEDDASRPP